MQIVTNGDVVVQIKNEHNHPPPSCLKDYSILDEDSEENVLFSESVNKWKEGYVENEQAEVQSIQKSMFCCL